MLSKNNLVELFRYDAYANRLVLAEVEKLSDEEFKRSASPSHGSVRQLMQHLFRSEVFFISACAGEKLTPPEPASAPEFCMLIDYVEEEAVALLAGLDETGLQRIAPIDLHRTILNFPVWQLLIQAYTHASHHCGELSIVLTELGHPLPTLDIILFFTAESGQCWPMR